LGRAQNTTVAAAAFALTFAVVMLFPSPTWPSCRNNAHSNQWQIAARLLLDGADAEQVTNAIELALLFDGRLGA
jgi:hypothetical protein